MNPTSSDAGIPILTEIISTPAQPDIPLLDSPLLSHQELEQQDIDLLDRQEITTWNEEELQRLEREITERVLIQLLANVDAVLENRVRDSLADVLQLAVSVLATDIRSGLQHSLQDLVTRAVAQEISKLKNRKN
ncbi:MAG: hypothetical protein V4632_11030 [Pseudomonadota bacterium]